MRINRPLAAFAMLSLATISGFAWFVLSPSEGSLSAAGDDPIPVAIGQPLPSHDTRVSFHRDETGSTPNPAPEQRQPIARTQRGDEKAAAVAVFATRAESPSTAPQVETNVSGLSEYVAYGPRTTDPSRSRRAEAAGGQTPGFLPSEVLDTSPVAVPLALLDPVPSATASAEQVAALNQLREGFADAVGGPKQDPDSPAYRKKWKAALPEADQNYRLWFGDQAYMEQQRVQYLDLNQQPR
jgi:hypothetical protein